MAEPFKLDRAAQIKRHIIGILAIGMGLLALWLNVIDPEAGELVFKSGSLRMTAVLAVLWLAFPETQRGPIGWMIVGSLIAAILFVNKAGKMGIKIIVPMIAVLGALAYLRRFTTMLSGKPPSDRRPR
jgi:uncharacterized BrkB/YihY/UPF0761 family membrane protein